MLRWPVLPLLRASCLVSVVALAACTLNQDGLAGSTAPGETPGDEASSVGGSAGKTSGGSAGMTAAGGKGGNAAVVVDAAASVPDATVGTNQKDAAPPVVVPPRDASVPPPVMPPPGKELGDKCVRPLDCKSGFCVDDVCCNSECQGSCRFCAYVGKAGTCANTPSGSKAPAPRQACATQDVSTCGTVGSCDGAGGCKRFDEGTECKAPTCGTGKVLGTAKCHDGECIAPTVLDCEGSVCRDLMCFDQCSTDEDCTASYQCHVPTHRCLSASALRIARAGADPHLDGFREEAWDLAAFAPITHLLLGEDNGDGDLEATFGALWNDAALYLLVVVTDEAIVNDSADTWNDDSVEVFIDGNGLAATTYDADDSQFLFRVGAQQVTELSKQRKDGITYAVAPKSRGYTMEIRIPHKTSGIVPFAGKKIGIDVHVNDDDNTGLRDAKKSWWGTMDIAWKTPSAFGTGILLQTK